MAGQNKKPAFHFNVGIISFLMIFVYIMGHLVIYLNRDELAVYEVIQSQIHDSVQTTGIILRDETIVKADKTGYMNYYIKENEAVAKNGLVYTCDETGEVHDYISNLLKQEENMTAEDYSDIRDEIIRFQDSYTDSQFQSIYSLKYDLEGKAMQMSDTLMAEHMDEIESKMGSDSFIKNYSKESGLITYLEDGFENKKISDLKKKDFDGANYTKTELKSADKIKAGDSVYRLTKGTDWQIVVPLTKEEYKRLKEKETVTVNISKDDLSVSCPISFEKAEEGYYGILSFSNYLVRYAKERYLNVEIEIETEDGLKIPNSAIVKKEFYKIPKAYFQGSSVAQKDLVMKKEDSRGKVTFETKTVDIGKSEDGEGKDSQGYYYVLAEEIPDNTVICMADSADSYLVDEKVELPGVYNINRGYADFRCVEVLMENKDYTIVKDDITNSIALFDRIVLNGNTIENNEIIY